MTDYLFSPIRLHELERLIENSVQRAVKNLEKDLEKQEDEVLDVAAAAAFLSLAVPTVYSLNSKGELPSMKRSKKLYFLKKDLLEYLKEGRRSSQAEIEATADQILKQKKRGLK